MNEYIIKNKIFYFSYNLIKKIKFLKKNQKKDKILTWVRSCTILPLMIDNIIYVYNGHRHIPIYITEKIVGYKLGEFVSTRYFKSHIESDKKEKERKFKPGQRYTIKF